MPQKRSSSQPSCSIRVTASAVRRPLGDVADEPVLVNVSERSLLVRSPETYPVGTVVGVSLAFVELDAVSELRAKVAWASEELHDMALEILEIDESGRTLIRRFLTEVALRR